MTLKDQFPTIQDFLKSRPDELGVAVVLLLQQTSSRFNVHNYPTDIAHLYAEQGTTPQMAEVWMEGVNWAKRALLIMNDPTQPSAAGWTILTREGRAFTREKLNLIRLQQLLPDFLLHPIVRAASLDIFNTGKYQSAVFEAFKAFEVATREAAGLDPHSYGDALVTDGLLPVRLTPA